MSSILLTIVNEIVQHRVVVFLNDFWCNVLFFWFGFEFAVRVSCGDASLFFNCHFGFV